MSLIVNGLSKRYGNNWAVRDVSFEVEGGSVIGLFGASASGKSSLLRAISGQTKVSGGTVTFDEADLTTQKVKERPVTYVGDRSNGTFAKLLSSFRSPLSTGEEKLERFESAMSEAGKIILLDDPFQQMDRDLRRECFARVKKIGKMKGKIVIFASSDFDQISELCDEVAFLSNGSIIQTGSPQSIYDEPATVEAARLTGEENLIVARRLTSTDFDIPEFHTIDGGHRLFAENTDKGGLGAINQNVTLAIRPEQVLMTVGTLPAEENLLEAKVRAIHRRGPVSLIEFDAGGLTLTTIVLKSHDLSVGGTAMLGLPPHRVKILKD